MPLSEITIYRDLPVIDGFVQVPPNQEGDKTRITADSLYDQSQAGFTRVRLTGRSGGSRAPGTCVGQQEFVRLPGIAATEWYAEDPVATYLEG